jgi:hypothetical protein
MQMADGQGPATLVVLLPRFAVPETETIPSPFIYQLFGPSSSPSLNAVIEPQAHSNRLSASLDLHMSILEGHVGVAEKMTLA